MQTKVYKPEFYNLNQELHVLKNNIFSGLIVRWVLNGATYSPTHNQEVYATGVQLDK